MMWNFLVGGLLTRRVGRALRRQPRHARPRRPLGPRRGSRHHLLRGRRRVHRRLPEGGHRARRGPGPLARSRPSARPARRSRPRGSPGSTSELGDDIWLFSTSRRHRRLHRVRGRGPDAARLPGRAAGARARRPGRGVEPRGQAARQRGRRARHHRADALDAASTSGATTTAAATARATSRCSRASGATATGSRSPTAAPRSSAAAPTPRSTAAASAWARARSTGPSSPSTRSSMRSSRPPPPGTDGYMPLFVVLRDGHPRRRPRRPDPHRIREDCSPRHVPDSVQQIAEVPRTLSGKVLELPVKRILLGADPANDGQPGRARQPRRARPFVEMARSLGTRPELGSLLASTVGRNERGRDESEAVRRGEQKVVDARFAWRSPCS